MFTILSIHPSSPEMYRLFGTLCLGDVGEKKKIKIAVEIVATNAPKNPSFQPDGTFATNEIIHEAPVTTTPPRTVRNRLPHVLSRN